MDDQGSLTSHSESHPDWPTDISLSLKLVRVVADILPYIFIFAMFSPFFVTLRPRSCVYMYLLYMNFILSPIYLIIFNLEMWNENEMESCSLLLLLRIHSSMFEYARLGGLTDLPLVRLIVLVRPWVMPDCEARHDNWGFVKHAHTLLS